MLMLNFFNFNVFVDVDVEFFFKFNVDLDKKKVKFIKNQNRHGKNYLETLIKNSY